MVKINIVEHFVNLQGEGKYTGKPSLFLRSSGCNLRCNWKNKDGSINKCDTPYTSWCPEKGTKMDFKDLEKIANSYKKDYKFNHIVITGGEPTLHKDVYDITNRFIDSGYIVTVETNGTILNAYNIPLFNKKVMMSVSPKLKSANALGIKLHSRNNNFLYNIKDIDLLLPNKQFKFVVNDISDFNEIKNILKNTHIKNDDVYIMPQALVDSEQKDKQKWAVDECLKNGYTYCTRLHVNIWGDKRGV